MKTFVACVLSLFLTSPAFASRIVIEDPCSDSPWVEISHAGDVGQSVGSVTIAALEEAAVPYLGTDAGINSIRGTVTGMDAMEVVSNTELRAYGWCFSVNDFEPGKMPDEILVTSEQDVIRWYFGYAHYKDGEWISYCTPTNQTRPRHVCPG